MTTDTQLNAYIETQSQAATDRAIILTKAKEVVNFTTQEMSEILGWEYHHVQPRISQLVEKDLLIDTGIRREGREKQSAAWAFNPEPNPKSKKMKPVGDKEKWGEMLRTAYAHKAHPVAHNLYSMNQAAQDWIMDFSNNLGDV
jgi:hypothetical protein